MTKRRSEVFFFLFLRSGVVSTGRCGCGHTCYRFQSVASSFGTRLFFPPGLALWGVKNRTHSIHWKWMQAGGNWCFDSSARNRFKNPLVLILGKGFCEATIEEIFSEISKKEKRSKSYKNAFVFDKAQDIQLYGLL